MKNVITLYLHIFFQLHVESTHNKHQFPINKIFIIIFNIFQRWHRIIIWFILDFNITIIPQDLYSLIWALRCNMSCPQPFKTLNISIFRVLEIKFTFILVASLFMVFEWLNLRLINAWRSFFSIFSKNYGLWIKNMNLNWFYWNLSFLVVVSLSWPYESCLPTQNSVASKPH